MLKAQIGVVFNPITNELFHAVKGQGAYLNGKTLKHSGQKGFNLLLNRNLIFNNYIV